MKRRVYTALQRPIASALLALALLVAPAVARADASPDDLWNRGNQAYLNHDFKGAIDAYEELLSSGASHEDLHYNLANAYVQADRLGPAIHHYELALGFDPTQEDARANLELTRARAAERFQDKLLGAEKDPYWVRGISQFTPGGLSLLFLGVYVLTFALAISAWLLQPGFLRVTIVAMLVFACAGTLGTGGLLAGRWYLATRVQQGIVLPDELAVKEGPDANYQTSFLVHAGLKLRVVEHDGDWLRVRLSNGLEGWTRDRDIGML